MEITDMEQKNTGGPAFPTAYKSFDGAGGFTTDYVNGMELRDYFAAKAMQGMVMMSVSGHGLLPDDKVLCARAYLIADDMLKEREQ